MCVCVCERERERETFSLVIWRARETERDRERKMSVRRMLSFADLRNHNRQKEVGNTSSSSSSSSQRPNFTGVWRQVRHENADEYFHAMGYPFALRRIMVHVVGGSTEVVSQEGERVHMKSINRRGEWLRTYVDNEHVQMRTADGQPVESVSWWERDEQLGTMVYKVKTLGAKQGTMESWRWIDDSRRRRQEEDKENDSRAGNTGGGQQESLETMVVKSIVYPKDRNGEAAHMFWHFEPVQQNQKGSSQCMLKSFEDSYVKGMGREKNQEEAYGSSPADNITPSAGIFPSVSSESLKLSLRSWLEKFSHFDYDRLGIFD